MSNSTPSQSSDALLLSDTHLVPELCTPELRVHQLPAGVAVVTLHRPEATNALSLSLQAALSQAFTALGQQAQVRCIVLTGGEQVFAAGGDIKSMEGCGPIDILQRHTERVWAPIERCPQPIIAAVCGYAFGGGAELAICRRRRRSTRPFSRRTGCAVRSRSRSGPRANTPRSPPRGSCEMRRLSPSHRPRLRLVRSAHSDLRAAAGLFHALHERALPEVGRG